MNRTLLCLLLGTGLGWSEPSPRLVVPVPHAQPISALQESPDGRFLATGDLSGSLKIWDTSTRQLQQSLSSQRGGFYPFWLGWLGLERVLCYGNDFRFHLFDVASGQRLSSQPEKAFRTRGGVAQVGAQVLFSPLQPGPPLLQQWDPVAWKQQASWAIPEAQADDAVDSLCVNAQGNRVCLGLQSGRALEMSLPDGKLNWQLDHLPKDFQLEGYSPDGETVLASGLQGLYLCKAGQARGPFAHHPDHHAFWVDNLVQYQWQHKAMEWDPAHPESERVLGSKALEDSFSEGVFGHQLVIGSLQGELVRASSGEAALLHPAFCEIQQLAYDRKGKIFAGLLSGQVVSWNLQSGARESLFEGKSAVVGMALSGNGKLLFVSRKGESSLDLYDLERRQPKGRLATRAAGLLQLRCSEDGRYLAGVRDAKLEVYDVQSGDLLQQRPLGRAFALASQGRPKLAVAGSGEVEEFDLSLGQKTIYPNYALDALEYDVQGRLFGLQRIAVGRLRFQPIVQRKDHELVMGPAGSREYRFDSRTPKLRLSFEPSTSQWLMVGDQGQVFQLSEQEVPKPLLPDAGNWSWSPLSSLANGSFVCVGREQTLEFWKPGESTPAGQLLVLNRGADWLVTDRSGLFDGTPEAERQVEWLVDNRKVRVDQIFEKAYRPGLLKSFAAASSSAKPATVAGLQISPPLVTFQAPASGAEIAQRIAEVRIRVQDQGGGAGEPRLFVNGKAVPQTIRREGDIYCLQAPLQPGMNELRCTALDKSGAVESRGDKLTVNCSVLAARKPRLMVIAVGVNQAGNAPKLSFAENDAKSLSEKLQSPLFDSSEVRLLVGEKARADSIRQSFQELGKEAQAQDTLVLFLAGHGSLDSTGYHFLMAPGQAPLDGPTLAGLLREFPAQKQLVILDTCHAGAASDEIAAAFAVNQQRMARGSGVYLLAACRSDQSALELPRLQHGLLTYSLLEGLQSAPPNSRQQVTVSGLIYFVCSQIPDLCHQIGLNQDVFQFVSGTDFPIRLSGKR